MSTAVVKRKSYGKDKARAPADNKVSAGTIGDVPVSSLIDFLEMRAAKRAEELAECVCAYVDQRIEALGLDGAGNGPLTKQLIDTARAVHDDVMRRLQPLMVTTKDLKADLTRTKDLVSSYNGGDGDGITLIQAGKILEDRVASRLEQVELRIEEVEQTCRDLIAEEGERTRQFLEELLSNLPQPQILIPPEAIKLQQAPAPVVNIKAADFDLPAPVVNVVVETPAMVKTFRYDEQGRPLEVIERKANEQQPQPDTEDE